MTRGREVEIPSYRITDVPDEDAAPEDPLARDRLIPPQTEAIAAELAEGDRSLCHCLDCGRQLVAIKHGTSCLFYGSEALVVE